MDASFTVLRAFVLEERSLFALAGEISAGMVQIGMRATLPGRPDFEARVHGVEFLHRPEDEPDAGGPALTFSYSKPEKLERWRSIDWPGRTLEFDW